MLNADPTLNTTNTTSQFNFRFGFLLPWTFRFLGILAVIGSFPLMVSNVFPGIALLLPGLIIIFTHEGFEIDTVKKIYRNYISFLLVKSGKFRSYDSIEKLYINKKRGTQRMYSAHTAKSATFSNEVYDVYMKFSSGEEVHLLSKKDKEKILKRIENFSNSLSIPVIDNTL